MSIEPNLPLFTKETVQDSLLRLMAEMAQVEDKLAQAQIWHDRAKEALADAEAALLLGRGPVAIDGKNAEMREAQLRDATQAERRRLQEAAEELVLARARAEIARQKLSAWKAIARLVAGEVD